ISRTVIRISAAPDSAGEPPSIAVSMKLISACSSRSKGVSNTSSAYFLPSLRWRVHTRKWSVELMA
uniref:Uncharacterized protein n=1 Tax=Chelonoidis abingdonii TaxID=106734 RepID=A0A8C0QRQ0_CHEAB